MSDFLKAREWVFLPVGSAFATGRLREDGSPEVRQPIRGVPPRAIFPASPAEASRLVATGAATPFEAGGKFAELLPAVSDLPTPAEAAEAGAVIKGVRVGRARRGEDGHWRPAPGDLGGFAPATDASFRSAKAIREYWEEHPKATPLFIIEQSEGTRCFAWVSGALVEALRN